MKILFKKLLIISVLISSNILFADDKQTTVMSPQDQLNHANDLIDQGGYVEAKAIYGKLLNSSDPDISGRSNVNLGLMYFNGSGVIKNLNVANSYFNIAEPLLKKSRSVKANWALGIMYMVQKDFANAEMYFKKVYNQKKDLDIKDQAKLILSLGVIYFNEKKFDDALSKLLEAYKLKNNLNDKDRGTLSWSIGNIYGMQGNFKDALSKFLEAYTLKESLDAPIQAALYINLGYAYEDAGSNKQALKYYQQAYDQNTDLDIKAEAAKKLGINI